MNVQKLLSLLFLASAMVVGLPAAGEPGLNVVITGNDSMRFSVTHINAQPGQVIHVEFRNDGTLPKEAMGHNWILLKAPGDAGVAAYAAAAMSAQNEGYEPKSRAGDVLASVPLLGPKQSAEVTFNAPTVPGRYPYFCSFPGHFQAGMKGELIVK
jgi:azurin